MYKNIALQAVSLLVGSVGHFDEVEIKEYFNQFQFGGSGLSVRLVCKAHQEPQTAD